MLWLYSAEENTVTMKEEDWQLLFELTPEQFTRLVAALFERMDYTKVIVVDGPGDEGIDVRAFRGDHCIAIQVKHKKHVTLAEIRGFLRVYYSHSSAPQDLFYVTSAPLPENVKVLPEQLPPAANVQFLGKAEIQSLLSRYPDIAARFLTQASRRVKTERRQFLLGILGVLASLIGLTTSLAGWLSLPGKQPLDQRIQNVESVLASIKNLEADLAKIKEDMQNTQKATAMINDNYAKAKELEKLTDVQLAAIQSAVLRPDWKKTFLNYTMGFILGVASSVVGNVLYSKSKQRKALE